MTFLYENSIIPISYHEFINDIRNTSHLQKYFSSNFNDIKTTNYCGFINVGGINYFIIPKISNDDTSNLNTFLYMLIYAENINLSNDDIANLSNNEFKIIDVFIRYFSNTLLEQLKKGLFGKYQTAEANLKVLKGKYIIRKNFENFFHQNIFSEIDEFTSNNELGNFFLFAIKTFMKYSTYINLKRCEQILYEVEFEHFDVYRMSIKFDRTNQRFQKSYELAILILKKLMPNFNDSNNTSFAFLFNMAEIFEKFIGKMYKNIDSSTRLQYQKNFGNLQLKPDIETSDMIIDTKYKIVKDRNDLATNDKYQMFTYGVNFGIKNTMLLYPKHFQKDFKDEDLKLGVEDNEVILKIRSIDLMSNGAGYHGYIEKIKNDLKALANEFIK